MAISAMVYSSPATTAAGKLLVQHVKLAFGFHRKAVDRVFDFHRRIAEEVAKAAAEERRRALQPEQPVEGFGAACRIFGQEEAELFRQIEQDAAGFKTRVGGVVEWSRSAGIFEFGLTSTKPLEN
jgi:hypothetical protein